MGKELTEREAIKRLDSEFAEHYKKLHDKYKDIKKFWCDDDYNKSQKELDNESGRRFLKLKEIYSKHELLPESVVMKIITGNF